MGEVINHWTDIAVAIMAVAAFAVALWSLQVSRDAFKLTKAQDDRRRPNLVPYLQEAYFVNLPGGGGREYSFDLSISNRSDADNSIREIALHVTYMVGGIPITAKLPKDNEPRRGVLAVPAKIAAHDTVSGWVNFRLEAGIIRDATIDGYAVVLTDSHGQTATLEPQVMRERHDD